jgi:hypothetical protein
MHPTSTWSAKPTQDDPADALDEGANGLAEAIAFDFGSKSATPSARPTLSALCRRWLRTTAVVGGIADVADGRRLRPAH